MTLTAATAATSRYWAVSPSRGCRRFARSGARPASRGRRAGGTVGVDRPVDDHDKLQPGQAWARTGMVFGGAAERATLTTQLIELASARTWSASTSTRIPTGPPRSSGAGRAAAARPGRLDSAHPPPGRDWLRFSADLDVAAELPRLAVRDSPAVAHPASPAEHLNRAAGYRPPPAGIGTTSLSIARRRRV